MAKSRDQARGRWRGWRAACLVACLLVSASPCAQSPIDHTLSEPLGQSLPELPESLQDAAEQWDRLASRAAEQGALRTRVALAWRQPVSSYAEGSAALAALSEPAMSSHDAVVLMLLATGCTAAETGCDGLTFAQRWVLVDSDNAAAWLTLWLLADRVGDSERAEQALAHAVSAPAWRDYARELNGALLEIVPEEAEVLVRLEARLQATPRVVSMINALYRPALSLCLLSAKHSACTALTQAIGKSPVTLLQATVAASLSQRFGGSDQQTRRWRERAEAYEWALAQNRPAGLLSSNPRLDAPALIQFIDRLNQQGEVEAARRVLTQMHLSEAEAASRYRDTRDHPAPVQTTPAETGSGLRLPRP